MENNIYYQLAQTECALDRYKAKLFKKNLALIGMAGEGAVGHPAEGIRRKRPAHKGSMERLS